MAAAALLARGLEAHRSGHNWQCPCPLGCGYTLSFCDTEEGGLLVHCFGGCDYDEVLAALVEHGLYDDDSVLSDAPPVVKPSAPNGAERIETARWIYGRLKPAAGTIAETYLRSRHITIAVPPILRCGLCPHRLGGTRPAMAAPVVDIDGEQTGVHMTYLRADGSGKVDLAKEHQRETRGVVRGGVIRLAGHDPNRALIIGEGIETTLSAMQLFGAPGWSAVNAGGLKTVDLPPSIRSIVIAADNDASGAGQRNALAAQERWCGEGRLVRIALPPVPGDDFNDVLRKRGRQ